MSYLKGDVLNWFEPYLRAYATKSKDDIKPEEKEVLGTVAGFKKALQAAFRDVDKQQASKRRI